MREAAHASVVVSPATEATGPLHPALPARLGVFRISLVSGSSSLDAVRSFNR